MKHIRIFKSKWRAVSDIYYYVGISIVQAIIYHQTYWLSKQKSCQIATRDIRTFFFLYFRGVLNNKYVLFGVNFQSFW